MEHRVGDPRILRLIRKWVKAGVMEEGRWSEPETGTPQMQTSSAMAARAQIAHEEQIMGVFDDTH